MTGAKKVLVFSILLLLVTSMLFFFTYGASVKEEQKQLSQAMKLSSIAIDTDKTEIVNNMIFSRMDKSLIINSKPYHDLVTIINRISDSMPVETKWSYLFYPPSDAQLDSLTVGWNSKPSLKRNDYVVLTVLTVDPVMTDPLTLPGVVFDIQPYPAMEEIVKESEQIVISDVVYDETYKNWNRAAFMKIYNAQGSIVAILGVETAILYEVKIIVNSLIFSFIYSILISVFATIFVVRYYESKTAFALKENE
jgi:hypothetical protein